MALILLVPLPSTVPTLYFRSRSCSPAGGAWAATGGATTLSPASTASAAPATLPTGLSDGKGSAGRSRARASPRLLRLNVLERFLDGGERGVPGVRQMANVGLPGSGEAGQELADKPAVTDGKRGGRKVVLVVTEAFEVNRDFLLAVERKGVELAPYRLL